MVQMAQGMQLPLQLPRGVPGSSCRPQIFSELTVLPYSDVEPPGRGRPGRGSAEPFEAWPGQTLHPKPSTLNPQPSALSPQP